MKYYDWKCGSVACPACGWSGRGEESRIGAPVGDCGFACWCPRCENDLGFVTSATDEETLSDPRASEADRSAAERHLRRRMDFERTKLKEPGQLPNLDPVPSGLVWDLLSVPGGDNYTVIRNGTAVVWRELAWYEGYERFGELAAILQQRYGPALRHLAPTNEGLCYLYGDSRTAPAHVDRARAALARGAWTEPEPGQAPGRLPGGPAPPGR